MNLPMTPLLASDPDLPRGLRAAIAEDRLEDAARGLIDDFGLSCAEAQDLLGSPEIC